MRLRTLVSLLLLSLVSGAAPAVPPIPEVGFWMVAYDISVKRATFEFADGSFASKGAGDDIMGWLVVDIRQSLAHREDDYVLLNAPGGGPPVTMWTHLPKPRPTDPPRSMEWNQWINHANQPDAIRYRAQGHLIVVKKPNGEPDDRHPRDPGRR